MSLPRLLIADDYQAIRYLFKELAAPFCEIVGEAATAQETLESAERLQPDLLLLDISLPDMSGFAVARLLRQRLPSLRIILASQFAERTYIDEALGVGIQGYILKARAAADMPTAIREVLGGHSFYSPDCRL